MSEIEQSRQNKENVNELPINKEDKQNSYSFKEIIGINLYRNMCDLYGVSFVNYLIFFNFLSGWFQAAPVLGVQYIYRKYMLLNPNMMSIDISIIFIPQCINILYGMISDNNPIYGYSRKPYIFIFGILESICFVPLFFYEYMDNQIIVTSLITIASLCFAWQTTVTNALICVMQRRDKEFGSQNMFSVSSYAQGYGGIIGSYLAALFTSKSDPVYIFIITSVLSLIVSIQSLGIDEEKQENQSDKQYESENQIIHQDLNQINQQQSNQKQNIFYELYEGLSRKELLFIMIYFTCDCFTFPNFQQYQYLFMIYKTSINQFQYSMINLITQVFQIIGTLIYQYFFQKIDTRTCIYYTVYWYILSDIMNCMFAERWNIQFGVSDFIFESIQQGIINNMASVILNLNIFSYCSKYCPNRIEGSVFAFIFMLNNLMYGVVSTVWAVFINDYLLFPPMSMKHLNQYKALALITLVIQPFSWITNLIVPSKETIQNYIEERENLEKEKYENQTQQNLTNNQQNDDENKGLLD